MKPGTLVLSGRSGRWLAYFGTVQWPVPLAEEWDVFSDVAARLTRERGLRVDGDPDRTVFYSLAMARERALSLLVDDLIADGA